MNIQKQIFEHLVSSKNIVIISHISPDGDSIGSSLALYHLCIRLNLNVVVCHPDKAPQNLLFLNGTKDFLIFDETPDLVIEKLREAETIVCLDFNDESRVGENMKPYLIEAKATKILIDHHLNPSSFAKLIYSDTNSCSTCQLIYELIEKSDNLSLLNKDLAKAIYLGLITDTGSFRYNSVLSKTHVIASKLLELNIQHDQIHEAVFDFNTVDKIKLKGYATSEKLIVLDKYQTAYISLSKEELRKFNAQKGDTEGLVNVALSLQNINMAAFFSEDEEKIKISFRSKGKNNPVHVLAKEHFDGGGHANAAGGMFKGKLEDAISKFIEVLPNFAN